jgi:hypothetical protein
MNLFTDLMKIQKFEFKATTGKKSSTNWNGLGQGKVITSLKNNRLFFKEEGSFKLDSNPKATKIFNEYIWTRLSKNKLRLSHSRFGYDNEVILFDLEPKTDTHWVSSEPHTCGKDLYSAQLWITSSSIKLDWNIIGPKKDEFITYLYIED